MLPQALRTPPSAAAAGPHPRLVRSESSALLSSLLARLPPSLPRDLSTRHLALLMFCLTRAHVDTQHLENTISEVRDTNKGLKWVEMGK